MEEEMQDLMQAYLDGTLQEPLLSNFIDRMEKDPTLKAEVEGLQGIDNAMHALGAESLADAVREWEIELHTANKSTTVRRLSVRRILSIAAGVAVVTAFMFLLRKPNYSSSELFASYYAPYENHIVSRGDGDDVILERAMSAYDNQNYQRAASLLQPYLEANPDERSVALYLGIAQMEISNYGAAETHLIEALNDPLYQQQADWYLALLYLRMDEKTKASQTLEKIVNMGDHYKEMEARELLRKL